MAERSFSQVPFPIVVAHRGASGTHPENTLEAFEAALETGAEAVEFDVRLTRDGAPVVMHDADVGRTTDGAGLVMDLRLEDVRALSVRGGSKRVPTLEEALGLLSGRAGVNIEIKNIPGEPDHTAGSEPVVEAVVAAIDAVAFDGPIIVSSFNPASIAATRVLAPSLPTGLLTDFDTEAEEALARAAAGGHAWLLPYARAVLGAADRFVERAHQAGIRVGVWLVDDPDIAVQLWRSGVDAVATNDPATMVAARREALGG